MAAEFGLPRQAVTAFSGTGRSYFLSRLVREVIFGEAGLVGSDPKVERVRRWIPHRLRRRRRGADRCRTGDGMGDELFRQPRMIEDVDAAVAKYDAEYAELGKRDPKGTDLAAILPPLTRCAPCAAATTSATPTRRSL